MLRLRLKRARQTILCAVLPLVMLAACASPHSSRPTSEAGGLARTAVVDPEVRAAAERVAQSDARVTRARADMLPQVSVTAGLVDDGTSAGDSDDGFEDVVGLRSSMPVFRGFSNINTLRQTEIERAATARAYDTSLETAIVRLATAVAQVDRDRQAVRVRKQELDNLLGFLEESRGRETAGRISQTDVEQIRVQVAETEASLATAQADLHASDAELKSLLNDVGVPEFRVVDLTPALPTSENAAIARALRHNPALDEARLRAAAARRGVEAAYGALAPQADLSVSGEHGSDTSSGLSGGDDSDFEIRLDLNLPVFSGGARMADVAERQAVYRETAFRYQAAERDLIARVQASWARHAAARQVIDLADSRLASATRALDGVREARRIGARTTTDELDARRDVLNAAIFAADARLQEIRASHDLLQALGGLKAAYRLSD